MTVLDDILNWSRDRPAWQRDALRRLVEKGELTEDDIAALTEICKAAHGLAEAQGGVPLDTAHLPNRNAAQGAVALESIFHHEGVNALAQDQTLKFGPRLTVVYGDNGAGKTGYTRILKTACRARGREQILGNVVAGAAPPRQVVAIKYRVQGEPEAREWAGQADDNFIARVSVFDTQSASVYLKEKTDVAFRPFGLDLFDKLVQAAKAVRTRLEAEQRALGASAISGLLPLVPEGTAVAKLLNGLSVLTRTEHVKTLATLTDDEAAKLALLEKSLLDLQAADPAKLLQQLKLRGSRVQALSQHVQHVDAALSNESVSAIFDARAAWRRKKEEADRLRAATFPAGLLPGTGSDAWKGLWQAASLFSQEAAYPGQPFPVVGEAAQCVLCQQGLDHDASHRLGQFAAFIASTTERELRDARELHDRQRKAIAALVVRPEAVQDTIKDLSIENEALAGRIDAALAAADARRQAVMAALETDSDLPQDNPAVVSVLSDITTLSAQLDERVKALSGDATAEKRKQLNAEAEELRARVLLAKHETTVLQEIDRKKRLAAYEQSKSDTATQVITRKSSEVTRAVVTQKLKNTFQEELQGLAFRHIEVELQEAGGAEGVLYHKLALTRAPGVELPKVVSEGEQRCLSIAAFFAELSTADDPSGIVFDDPVSSLDYRWREGVALRLVEAAKTRQVIIFTHDVVFLLWLKQFAEEQQVEQLDQHIRQLSAGAGVCTEELPWVAMPIRKKIGHLNSEYQAAAKLSRDGHQDAYEKEAKNIYGLLREAWERALEEVLLCKIVERYRPGVQTQQIAKLADVTEEDCRQVDAAMTKCSRWLRGHDQAAAARAPVPGPDELKADIDALDSWVKAINKRRG
ncbi:TPA: AAA family ATPase [Pseudomonas aeruginosa]|uniref:AAA family ATPase n=1 Tax=Pseudomonas aeruginosa TaxID=287 RepID=UPI00053E6057|nr:AAA family ATPase [Pseudomonas aeruginosa]